MTFLSLFNMICSIPIDNQKFQFEFLLGPFLHHVKLTDLVQKLARMNEVVAHVCGCASAIVCI